MSIGIDPVSITPQYNSVVIKPNTFDSKMMLKHIETYEEFPPVFKTAKTRWGDNWDDNSYPTTQALLEKPTEDFHNIYHDEAQSYTWINYTKLK